MRTTSRAGRAFTLLEVVISVATLSVLSVAGWVSYQAYQGAADESVSRGYLRAVTAVQEREWSSVGQYETSPDRLAGLRMNLTFTQGISQGPDDISVHVSGTSPSLGLAVLVARTGTCLTAYLPAPGSMAVEDSFQPAGSRACDGTEAAP